MIDRRDMLKGIGVAAAATAIAGMTTTAIAEEAPMAYTYADFDAHIKKELRLDGNIIGVKFFENIEDVPDYAVSPMGDMGKHMSTCQAFALAKYNNQVTVMTPQDEWCWAPLVGYGMVDCSEGTESFEVVAKYLNISDPEKATRFYADVYPRLPLGKYAAWVIGPIAKLDFEPDVTMIWADPFAINWCALVAKSLDAKVITPEFDGIDSCIYEVVNTIEKQDYQIAIPDPGEIVRARTKMTDLTFTIPGAKLNEFIEKAMNFNMKFNFEVQYEYPLDYSRPPFYNEVYAMWGLETGQDWAHGDSQKDK